MCSNETVKKQDTPTARKWVTDDTECQKLKHLLKTKKWNPYCIRHSAITADSDFLPEYALKKKVRWSMNSKQGARYIEKNGQRLETKDSSSKWYNTGSTDREKTILNCPRCSLVNAADNKYCSKCSYQLIPSAFEEIKAAEDMKFRVLEERFNNMQSMLEKLVTGLRDVTDQHQVNTITESLFLSVALKVTKVASES